jgi:succinoglycan biosynthesis transport protein ExoP
MTKIPENNPSQNNVQNEPSPPHESVARSGTSSGRRTSSNRAHSGRSVRIDRRTIEALRRPSGGAPSAQRELNLFDIIGIFKRQLWIVIVATLIGMAVAGYYSQNVTPRYAAYSSVYIPETNSMSILSGVGVSNSRSQVQNLRGDTIETHALIIKSYEIMSKTWRAILADSKKAALLKTIELPKDEDDKEKSERKAVAELARLVSVSVGGDQRKFSETNTISISCQSYDPEEAAMIVNMIVEQYKLYFTEKYNKSNEDVRVAIEQSKKDIDKEIELRKQELFNFIQESPTTFIGGEESNPLLATLVGMSEKKVELDFQKLRLENQLVTLTDALGGRSPKDLEDAELISMLGGGDSEAILTSIASLARGSDYDSAVRTTEITYTKNTLATRIQDLELKLLEARQNYSSGHSVVQTLEQQIAELKASAEAIESETEKSGKIGVVNYSELFESYLNALARRIEQLTKEQEKIDAYIDSRDDEVRKITQYRETLETMKVSIESLKSMQVSLDQNLKQLSLMSDVNTYQVEVLSAASPSERPVYPNVLKFIIVGFVLGSAVGVVLAYLIDITDATFHTPAEIQRALRIPILTHLVSFKHRMREISAKKRAELREQNKPEPELLAYYKPNDAICEVFRQLRTRLFNQPAGSGCVVVMNTSPHPTDGKTMIISNLAVKVAEAGKRVLLIDGDMRKPDIHKMFGVNNELGLSNILLGECGIEDGVTDIPIKNLKIMTAGTRSKKQSPAELIAGQGFDEMLTTLREQFDVILIDTPPVLYVNDAATIAPRTDGVLYVFRIRRRGRPDVVSGVRALVEVNANMLGCVVNCYDKHRFYNEFASDEMEHGYGGYGYGYGGGYGGGYGYGGYGYGSPGYGGYGYGYGGPAYGGYGYGSPGYGGYGYGAGYGGYGAGYGNYGGYGGYGEGPDDAQAEGKTRGA